MDWKFVGGKAVYLQIMAQIRTAVLTGGFAPGQRLPSVRDLAMDAQVNPNTMQRALHELEQEKLLITDGTNGRFVTGDEDILAALRTRQLQELTVKCVRQFAAFGVSAAEAAKLMTQYEEEREDV